MKEVFALIDCNNFYALCERVFNPKLQNKPVLVLSNNDGCVVARSNEVKALGIKMGVPAFEVRENIKKHNVEVFSSNYSLYADMSSRVMETLSALVPQIEVYSIDEAFLNLAGFTGSLTDLGRKIKDTVEKWTGLPVTIGIARTKTLAKVANKIAKRSARAKGVLDLTDSPYLTEALKTLQVQDVWGIGCRTAAKLKKAKITTALDLSRADISWIKQKFGVTGARTVYELGGTSCYPLEANPPAKKSVAVSRSFGKPVETIAELKEAVAAYASRLGEKLRKHKLAANLMTVFITTSRFVDPKKRYYNSLTCSFPVATSDTTELIQCSLKALQQLYRKGYRYKKAGIVSGGLIDENKVQLNLFDTVDRNRSKRLMQAIDTINTGSNTPLKWAAEGLNQPWKVKFNRPSKRYTTSWTELVEVKTCA